MEELAKDLFEVEIEEEMKRSYIDYAMSVIVGRALPDVRDGLKPVHRRILYAMHDMGMTPNKPYKKCARIVGEVLGKYHPHGDTAVYDSLVRMAQPFSYRKMLVDGHGNFGSIDDDAPAAMRYTEARLAPIAMEMLSDLDKNTVDFTLNFDETLEEPTVLPSRFPNLLVNGSSGIAVGMSTNIPPHNLGEVIDATIAYIENSEITIDELTDIVKGPDFPAGGIIVGLKGIKNAYRKGRGSIKLRGFAEIEDIGNGKSAIIVKEIPFQVNKSKLSRKIAKLVRDKKITEITDLRDESDQEGTRLVIELKKTAIPKVVLNKLYKHTQLEVTFGVIMIALVDGVPKLLNLKEVIHHYVGHQRDVIVRRTKYELEIAEKRAHILEGLLIALANLDEVISIIRKSNNPEEAKKALVKNFELTEVQAKAILNMRLQKLTRLESDNIKSEHTDLIKQIEYLRGVLADPKKIDAIIIEELKEIKEKHDDRRRTRITASEKEISIKDLIPDTDVAVLLTASGYIKRVPVRTYKGQHRGGKGVTTADLKEGDWIRHLVRATNHQYLLLFTNLGRAYKMRAYQVPEASRTARGKAIVNLIPLKPGEEVVSALPVREFDRETEGLNLLFISRKGTVKKTALNEYASTRRDGIRAVRLRENDSMVQVRLTDGKSDVILLTKRGQSIRFHETDVRRMGRNAIGVKGINLKEGDYVFDAVVVEPEESLFLITEGGYGKRTDYENFPIQKRGGKGVIAIKITERKGFLAGAKGVLQNEELMVVSAEGQAIRVSVGQIPTVGRQAQGVRIMKLNKGDKVSAIAIL